jgi:hypothetical protein
MRVSCDDRCSKCSRSQNSKRCCSTLNKNSCTPLNSLAIARHLIVSHCLKRVTRLTCASESTPLRSQCLGIEENIYYQYTPLHHQSNTDIAEQLVGTLKLAQDKLRTSKTPVTVDMNENNLDARPFSLFNVSTRVYCKYTSNSYEQGLIVSYWSVLTSTE